MSNSNRINIAAAAEAFISWRDASPKNDHGRKASKHTRSNERKDAAVSLPSLSQLLVKDGKRRSATDSNKEECESAETIDASSEFKLNVAGSKRDESTCEESASCSEEDLLCLTPTKDEIGRIPNVSPLRNYIVKQELWDAITTYCVELNERAKKLYNAGQNSAALELLREAESQRQKLVDLVESERYAQMYCQIVHHSGKSDCPPLFPILLDHSTSDGVNILEDEVEAKTNYIYQRSHFDEGMRLFEDLESINMSSFSVTDTQSDFVQVCPEAEATITFNIGQVLYRQGDLEGASKCYEDALRILKHTAATTTFEVFIPILHNFGNVLYHRDDLRQAKEMYSQAYDHSIQKYGTRHTHVVSLSQVCDLF